MSGLDFLEFLQSRGVLDKARAAQIRSKLVKPGKPISAERLAKYLVEKTILTSQEASKLFKEFKASASSVTMLSEADAVDLMEVADLEVVEDLGSELVPLGPESGASSGPSKETPQGTFKAKAVLENRWESKWMIIGPTLIIVLLMVGLFLYFVLVRRSAEEMLDAAEKSYRAQSYSEAIEAYEEFLNANPKHPESSMARVRMAMANIRRFSGSKQWDKALEVLPEQLEGLEEEDAFSDEGRPELLTILPDIAMGLVENAEKAANVDEKANKLKLAQNAMAFVDNSSYMPASSKRQIETRLTELTERFAAVERSILRERKLVDTIGLMDQAIADKQTIVAFEARKSLLREFPDLIDEPRLVEAAKRVADGEMALVTPIPRAIEPIASADANDSVGTINFASRFGAVSTDLAGQVHPVLVRGSVYMLDASNGNVLWRRFVGYETNIQPMWVNGEGSDVIVASQRDQEVMRVEARTGNVVWRSKIGTPITAMAVASTGVIVTARDGHVLRIANESNGEMAAGSIVEGVQVPQTLAVGPAVDRSGKYLYQAGLEANLYVIESVESESRMVCREVFYLGHSKGSIAVPPVLVQGLLFVVENSGLDYSTLHVLRPTQRGLGLEPAQNSIRLRGEVLVASEIYGPQSLMVLTDRGEISLYAVDPTAEDTAPVSRIAGFDRQTPAGTYSLFVANRGKLWIGDEGLAVFNIQAQRGRIDRETGMYASSRFLAPFAIYGPVLIQVRQNLGSDLATISAHHAESMEEIWSTNVGAPLAGAPHREIDGTAVLVTSNGDQFVLDETLIAARVGIEPRRQGSATETDLVFRWKLDFGNGRAICFGPPEKKRVLGLDPAQRLNTAPISDSAIPQGTLAFPPVKFGEFVLAGSTQGPLFLLDSLRAQSQGIPFQPATGPEQQIVWARPCVLNDQTFVIADVEGNVYRIGREGNNLAKQEQGLIEGRTATPLASLGTSVILGVTRGNESQLVRLDGMNLASPPSVQTLPGDITFGPVAIGEVAILGTSNGQVHAVSEDGAVVWSQAADSAVVGVGALDSDGRLVISTSAGTVLIVDAATGEVSKSLDAGEPLAGDPFLEGGRLFAPTYDGTLRVFDNP